MIIQHLEIEPTVTEIILNILLVFKWYIWEIDIAFHFQYNKAEFCL